MNSNCTNKHKIHQEQSTNLLTQTIQPDFEYKEDNVIPLAMIVTSLVQTYSLKAGIKKFGTKDQQAVFDEMNQLHLCSCFNPIDVTTLIPQEQARVLNSLSFLTEKLMAESKQELLQMEASNVCGKPRKKQQVQLCLYHLFYSPVQLKHMKTGKWQLLISLMHFPRLTTLESG